MDLLFDDKASIGSLDRRVSAVDELISHAVTRHSYPCCKGHD
ncbi:hypothetical protein AALP_AA8G178600 [Arabis alpina]|uniref:Uncharacterized protein n=1 Tax=Arabis alpina TaxID=50452 RepID=A0A087G7Q8_ARAAL|nr:hypothetical protein AALP_AA8G178600 [Arabis alpina]